MAVIIPARENGRGRYTRKRERRRWLYQEERTVTVVIPGRENGCETVVMTGRDNGCQAVVIPGKRTVTGCETVVVTG